MLASPLNYKMALLWYVVLDLVKRVVSQGNLIGINKSKCWYYWW